MRVLLATPLYSQHFDAGHFWLKALNDLGHFVRVWDYRLNPGGIRLLGNVRPPQLDLTLVLKGDSIDPTRLPHPRVCYWPDALERTPGIESVLKLYDRVFTPERPTPSDMTWLPTGWDPDIHLYTGAERDMESLYIGTKNSNRKWYFLKTIRPLFLAGNGWERWRGVLPREKIWPRVAIQALPPHYLHDFVALASRALVAVNIHQGPVGLNRKLFELIPCAFTITDLVPGVEEVLGDITDRVAFTTPEGAREKVDYFLSHPNEREELWQIERERIAPYTYLEAVKRVLSSLG